MFFLCCNWNVGLKYINNLIKNLLNVLIRMHFIIFDLITKNLTIKTTTKKEDFMKDYNSL